MVNDSISASDCNQQGRKKGVGLGRLVGIFTDGEGCGFDGATSCWINIFHSF
jgi:hypothetical protein